MLKFNKFVFFLLFFLFTYHSSAQKPCSCWSNEKTFIEIDTIFWENQKIKRIITCCSYIDEKGDTTWIPHGLSKFFYSNGQLGSISKPRCSKEYLGSKTIYWYETGIKREVKIWKGLAFSNEVWNNEQQTNERISKEKYNRSLWYENGKRKRKVTWCKDISQEKQWHENGKLKAVGKRIAKLDFDLNKDIVNEDDKVFIKFGLWKYYDEKGSLIKTENLGAKKDST